MELRRTDSHLQTRGSVCADAGIGRFGCGDTMQLRCQFYNNDDS